MVHQILLALAEKGIVKQTPEDKLGELMHAGDMFTVKMNDSKKGRRLIVNPA